MSQSQPTAAQPSLTEQVVDFMQLACPQLEKAAAAAEAHEKQAAAVQAAIPAAVDALISGELILPTEREKAAQLLRDPVQSLHLLTKLARQQGAAAAPRRIGTTEKIASLHAPGYVGPVQRGPVRKSTELYYEGLGLPIPATEHAN